MNRGNDRRGATELARIALTVVFCAAAFTAAGAQGLSDIPAAFVDVGIGARPMGAGGAVAAGNLGSESIFYNSAGLAPTSGATAFSVTHGEQMGLVPYSAASASHSLGNGLTLGVGLIHSGDDVLTETTVLIGAAREITATPWCPGRAIGMGVTVRGRRASFGNNESTDGQVTGSASGFGLDAGALVPLTEAVTLGLSGRDIFNSLTWESSASGSYSENVPAGLAIGLRAVPHGHVTVEVDVEKALRLDNADRLLAGIELSLWNVASLRGGYRRDLASGDSVEYTVGAGALLSRDSTRIRIDAAYVFGRIQNTMRFSLGVEL